MSNTEACNDYLMTSYHIYSITQGQKISHTHPHGGKFSPLWAFLCQPLSGGSALYKSNHIGWFVTRNHPSRSTCSPQCQALRNYLWNGVCLTLSTCFCLSSPIAMSRDMNIFRWEKSQIKFIPKMSVLTFHYMS